MKGNRSLIVCDDAVRRNFIQLNLNCYDLEAIYYPNYLSARKAIQLDPFVIIVVDLLMPIEQKLALIDEACKSQPDTPIVTIEKKEYLEDIGFLTSHPSIVSLESIQMLSHVLEEYVKNVDMNEDEE